jgi:hypothetical protein
MQHSRPDRARIVELAAIGLVIAIPIALIAATWEPLETPPRQSRDSAVERDGPANADDAGEEEADRGRPRERRAQASPAAASPGAPAAATAQP